MTFPALLARGTGERGSIAVLLRELPSPWSTVPGVSVVQAQVEDDVGVHADATLELPLPATVAGSAPARQRTFISGRACATLALRRHGHDAAPIAIAPHGAPAWPDGIVGSITHTARLAEAIVASAARYRGIGIDVEELIAEGEAPSVASAVAPELLAGPMAIAGSAVERALAITAVFSAKESLYKCVRPLVDDFFDFTDAQVRELDMGRGHCRLQLTRDLGAHVPAGAEFIASIQVAGDVVHSLVTWEA